ncbi:hypothetical protein HN51_000192 [Arachis hypogaea]
MSRVLTYVGLRSLLRAREQGPFFYHYEGAQDGDGNIRARSGYSDRYELPLPHSVSVRQYSEDYDLTKLKNWYNRQVLFNYYDGNLFLRMHYLHLSKKRVVSDSFEYDLSSWLMHKKDTAPYSDANTWWAAIRREFILIFKPVFEGLKILHLREEYHGNLDSESCIKIICKNGNVTRGILTNMEEKVGSKSTLRERDAQHLREIIEKVITFPFIGTSESSEEVRELCLQQLGAYSCQTDLMIKWSLDPVLFWDTRRRIQFLEAVDWLYHRNVPQPSLVKSTHRYWTWDILCNDQVLVDVYFHEQQDRTVTPQKYSEKHNLIRFYRNCIHHADFGGNGQVNCPFEIHKLFLVHYDVFPPSIRTATYVLKFVASSKSSKSSSSKSSKASSSKSSSSNSSSSFIEELRRSFAQQFIG